MLEIKLISTYFLYGFVIAFIYESILFFKRKTNSLIFSHILLDLFYFYFAICYLFTNLNLSTYSTGIIYLLLFCIIGFITELSSLHFLIDKCFNFVYTKLRKVGERFLRTKISKKILK